MVNDLGRKLFYDYQHGSLSSPLPPWDDDPAVFVAGLEETVEGCRWLIDRGGDDLRTLLERDAEWSPAGRVPVRPAAGQARHRGGQRPGAQRHLPGVGGALGGAGEILWEMHLKQTTDRDPAMVSLMVWREIAPRPADKAKARRVHPRGDRRAGRAAGTDRVAEFEQIAEAEAAERADRAAFDPSPSFERHRRHQSSLGRELLRTIDTLRRLRKVEVGPSVHDGEGPLTGASASTPPTQPPGEGEARACTRGVAGVRDRAARRHPRRARACSLGRRRVRLRPSHPVKSSALRGREVHEHESRDDRSQPAINTRINGNGGYIDMR